MGGHGCESKEGHGEHGKHEHHKELWQAFKDENMPADERIAKLEELKGIFTKKIEKIESVIAQLKQ